MQRHHRSECPATPFLISHVFCFPVGLPQSGFTGKFDVDGAGEQRFELGKDEEHSLVRTISDDAVADAGSGFFRLLPGHDLSASLA